MKKYWLLFLVLLTSITFASAIVQPSQQSNKLLLSPFYVNAMVQNTNYTYNVTTIVPDGISSIKTAIVTLDAWISPTRTFNAWVNGIQCLTQNYTISTTYAAAGRGVVTFDCTNAVKPMQTNIITFRVTGGNIGASTAWLDLTYMTNPKGDLNIHGTEYNNQQNVKVWLQLLDNGGEFVTNGTCYIDVYTPDNQEYVEQAVMNNFLHDGIYYYDFQAPNIDGVYPVIARCYYGSQQVKTYAQTYTVLVGKNNRTIAYDDFECNGFNCGSTWNAAWSFTGTCEISTTPTPIGTYSMRGQSACDASRRFNDLDYANVSMTFYVAASSLEAAEFCRYYYFDGTNNQELLSLTDGNDTGTFWRFTFDVSNYAKSSTAGIRMTGGPGSGDYCYIDNISIVGRTNTNINLTQEIDGNSLGIIENTIGGVARLNATMDFNTTACNAVPETLLTGVSINVYGKFDSVVNDDITISLYNWTSGTWKQLNNKLLEGSAYNGVSNLVSLTNLTKSGYYNTSAGIVRIKFNDSGFSDTAESVLLLDQVYFGCEQANDPIWQDVKGSSEVHISSVVGVYPFQISTLCGEGSQSNVCSQFLHDDNYWNYTWGYIYDNVSIINSYQTTINTIFNYETPQGIDCTGFIDVLENGVTSIAGNVQLSQGLKENCVVGIPVVFDPSDREKYYEITFDNYMGWEVQRARDIEQFYSLIITPYCEELATVNNNPYEIPFDLEKNISQLYADNPLYLNCYRMLDDIYWFETYYNSSLDITMSGPYEAYYFEIVRYYYPELIKSFNIIQQIKTNSIELFKAETICEKITGQDIAGGDDFSCQIINPPDSYFSSQEGWTLGNVTFTNTFHSSINSTFVWQSAVDTDCSAILDIIRIDENGNQVDIYNETTQRPGTQANCKLVFPIQFQANETSFDIIIKAENFIHWNMFQMRDKINAVRNNSVPYCQNLLASDNISYWLPINESIDILAPYFLDRFCWRTLDDYYWFDYYSEQHDLLHNATGTHYLYEILPSYFEFKYFYPFILEDEIIIKEIEDNRLTTELINNVEARVWNYTSRNLTYYAPANVDVDSVSTAVWNATTRNLTYYPPTSVNVSEIWNYEGNISVNITQSFADKIWNFIGRYVNGIIN